MVDAATRAPEALYLEDLVPGRRFVSPEHEITADSIVAFAREYDPQPFHVSPDTAADTFFGRHVASGWQTTAVAMRLMVEALPIAGGVIGAGCERIAWPRPVHPGDRLHLEIEVEAARPSGSRPEIGLVNIRVTGLDQEGRTAIVMHPRLVVPVRGAE